jgi:uncharacterized protein YndB with AHSA1/START domain
MTSNSKTPDPPPQSQTEADANGRRVVAEVDLFDVVPEDVWTALTDAEHLTRWFPLEARVEPGEGGEVFMSWGEGWAGSSRIEVWDPPRRLRLVETRSAYDAEGRPVGGTPVRIAMDWEIEGRAGTTRLRLVHSGFGAGADWDDEVDSIRRGWKFELGGLAQYLAHHRGRDRSVAWVMRRSMGARAEVWARLCAALPGLDQTVFARPGDDFSIALSDSSSLAGRVAVPGADHDFAGTLPDRRRAYVRIGVESGGGATHTAHVFLAGWGEGRAEVEALRSTLEQALEAEFPPTEGACSRAG